jgi:hypothetical protein
LGHARSRRAFDGELFSYLFEDARHNRQIGAR